MSNEMTMTYELITPKKAGEILARNQNNRKISKSTVRAYANDMIAGNWDESTGTSISIDENGILKDGQHRLTAIRVSGISIHMWVCRNVSNKAIYDNNRKRSNSDQLSILRPDFNNVYKSTRYISVARVLISPHNRRTITPKELIDFTDEHKKDLDGFFLEIQQKTVSKISITAVFTALYMAYMAGVNIEDIKNFYSILSDGMSTKPEEFPIIAYRNYLKDVNASPPSIVEIGRCQYALKKYLTKSCTKRTMSPKNLIWPFPYQKGDKR